ncbi:hypothetical protein R1flu_018599 [Riccia fluitans]|uniref:Uncharacterized protein n=1 Tax=Riccia fluitans TaxID=41844 RepID=A0ABD1ZHU0_9MARC
MKILGEEAGKPGDLLRADDDEEIEEARPSSLKYVEARVEAEEVPTAETSEKAKKKAPEVEEEVPTTAAPAPNKEEPNTNIEPDQRRSKQKLSSPRALMDKLKVRKKTMKMKKPFDTIDLSDDEPQKVKREEEMVLAEDTSPILEADKIEKFRLSMVYGA